MSLCYRYVLRKMASGHKIFVLDDEEHPDWVDRRGMLWRRGATTLDSTTDATTVKVPLLPSETDA